MQEVEETLEQQDVPPLPISEPLTPLPDTLNQSLTQEEADEIFFEAVVEIPTQPLNRHYTPQFEIERKIARVCAFALFLFLSLLLATVIASIVFQPIVTLTLVPLQKSVSITNPITIPTRTLVPVTITRSLTAPTTGKGHQDATVAAGTLTFYNGLATSQTIQAGAVFPGSDRVEVVTDEPVTIPPDDPPMNGHANVSAHAMRPGSQGNISALDINSAVSSSLFIKNLTSFSGGRDARDFQAVAKSDLTDLTSKLHQQLIHAMPQAFTLRPGEAVHITDCMTHITADHHIGEEAHTVTVNTSQTCGAIAYNRTELEKQTTAAFMNTRPGKHFELIGSVQTTIVHVTPFLVRLSGSWEYVFSQDDEQLLAQHIQGETPKEARAYLFTTGFVSRVTMTQTDSLPDCYHIKFLILAGV